MRIPTLLEFKRRDRGSSRFGAFYAAIVLFALHWAIIVYINSSFLSQFLDDKAIGILYTVSSGLTIFLFVVFLQILRRSGNYYLTILLSLLELMALVGMAFADSAKVAVPLFVLHQAIVPIIIFNLDVFMEKIIGEEEGTTGGKRGLSLTIISFAGAISPLAAGFLLGEGEPRYSFAYLASALFVVLLLILLFTYFRKFEDSEYSHVKLYSSFCCFWAEKDLKNVFFAHFLLQLFFVWSVIYIPLYLSVQVGFNWEEVGLILFAGLMAYVFLEYPIGLIADRWIGEKEMMALGFLILAVSISWFTFMETTAIELWMLAMFLTRVGASLIETTTESYFFKHISGSDINAISFFRITRPLSYVFGALFGSFVLLYLPFSFLFLVMGLLLIPGFFFTMALRDTK